MAEIIQMCPSDLVMRVDKLIVAHSQITQFSNLSVNSLYYHTHMLKNIWGRREGGNIH